MSARSIRRAEARLAKKLARKAGTVVSNPALQTHPIAASGEELDFTPEPIEASYDHTISEAQLAANRRNALFSTGPTSEIGRTKSCLNALKTGLTGQTVLLPSEDVAEYSAHLADYEQGLKPVGRLERDLVQSLADTRWRLNRIPGLEMAIYALGHVEFGPSFQQHPAEQRAAMIELQTLMTYEKQLKNLQIQEARLHRRYEKDLKALRELQTERHAAEKPEPAAIKARSVSESKPPVENGFEFSTSPVPTAVTLNERSQITANRTPALIEEVSEAARIR